MSIISCFFIFLLCLSKQSSCKARHIGVHQKGTVEKVQIQMELTKGVVLTKGENYIMASDDEAGDAGATATTQGKMSSSKSSETSIKERLKHIRGKISGGVLKKHPLVYVSWSVPSKNQGHKNHNDRHSGIFSDYSRPRTRPPSHN